MVASDKNSREVTLEKVQNGDPYKIPQTERLYTARPRYFDDKTTRGRVATFRLLTYGVASSPSTSAAAALAERVRKKLTTGNGYADFLVESMQLGFNEKAQIIQTFGDAETVYYFGRTPTTININGTLIDDIDNDWFVRFIEGYNTFLRGTQLAKNFELLQLSTHNATFTGSLMNLQFTQAAGNDVRIPFTCTFLIKSFEFKSSYQYGTELRDEVEYKALTLEGEEDLPTVINVTAPQVVEGDIVFLPFIRGGAEDRLVAGFIDGSFGFAPAGYYTRDASTSFNETLGGIADRITKISESINKFAGVAGEVTTDLLNPINDIIGSVKDITSAAFSVVSAIDTTVNSVLDPIAATVQNLVTTERQLKNLRGTISSLPENLSEKISRFARAGGISNPAFLNSPSANVNSAEALATMKNSNIKTLKSTGLIGPATQSTSFTADTVARL